MQGVAYCIIVRQLYHRYTQSLSILVCLQLWLYIKYNDHSTCWSAYFDLDISCSINLCRPLPYLLYLRPILCCLKHIITALRLGKTDRLFDSIPLQQAEIRHLAAAWYMSRSVRTRWTWANSFVRSTTMSTADLRSFRSMLWFVSYVVEAFEVVIMRWTASRSCTMAVLRADRGLDAETR